MTQDPRPADTPEPADGARLLDTDVWDDDDGTRKDLPVADQRTCRVRITATRCSTCIFSPGNRMSLVPGAVEDLVADAHRDAGHIVCHSTLPGVHTPADGTQLPPAVCRGYAEQEESATSLALGLLRAIGRATLVDTYSGELTDVDDYRDDVPTAAPGAPS